MLLIPCWFSWYRVAIYLFMFIGVHEEIRIALVRVHIGHRVSLKGRKLEIKNLSGTGISSLTDD